MVPLRCRGLRRKLQFPGTCLRALATDRSHLSAASAECISLEKKRDGLSCTPLPLVLTRGYGARLWDLEGREYLDFFSARSAVNQGHCHPRLVTALAAQAATISLTSREFHSDKVGAFADKVCATFGYDSCVPLTTDAEARELAVKLARRWAHKKKEVPRNKVTIFRAMASAPTVSSQYSTGSPTAGIKHVKFGDLAELEEAVSRPFTGGFILEPILSDPAVHLPPPGYLRAAAELCVKHNVLFIVEENLTGLGRTGKMLCVDHYNVKPDIVTLGNALGGGMVPVSAVLGRKGIINLSRGERPSIFGGCPLTCAVSMEAINVVVDEKLADRAEKLGHLFRKPLEKLVKRKLLKDVRGLGLLNAIEFRDDVKGNPASKMCLAIAQQGILAEQASASIVRFTPPLVISKVQLTQASTVIRDTVSELVSVGSNG